MASPARSAPGDLALLGALLAVNLVPLLGLAAGIGRWSAGTLGFATACALLCGRQLALDVCILVRSNHLLRREHGGRALERPP